MRVRAGPVGRHSGPRGDEGATADKQAGPVLKVLCGYAGWGVCLTCAMLSVAPGQCWQRRNRASEEFTVRKVA
ncbi:unnamed protein product [Lota lota]